MSDEGFTSITRRWSQSGSAAANRDRLTAEAAEEMVASAQAQLERLAGKRGQVAELAPAISKLKPLLKRSLAAPPPPEKEKKAGADGTSALGVRGRIRKAPQRGGYRRRWRFTPPQPQPPPPKPYAPLRWPPVGITMGVLKGRLAPAVQPRKEPAEYDVESYSASYFDEDVLDIAERFEEKLGLGRGGRGGRASASASGRGGGGAAARLLSDPKHGPPGLRRGRWTSGPEATRLLAKQAQLAERKERKAALAHEEARKDSHRCFRASKNAASVAELWPYK